MNIHRLLFCFALLAGALAAQGPSFEEIVNPASNIPPGFALCGIAEGSGFVVNTVSRPGSVAVPAGFDGTDNLSQFRIRIPFVFK